MRKRRICPSATTCTNGIRFELNYARNVREHIISCRALTRKGVDDMLENLGKCSRPRSRGTIAGCEFVLIVSRAANKNISRNLTVLS